MKFKKLLPLFILLGLWFSVPVTAQDIATDHDIAEADEYLKSKYDELKIPGLSVSVYRDGKMIWSEGFGYKDLETKVPVNPQTTLFRIGSVSKTYTAAGVGVLMDEGKLDLKEVIQTYVPEFPEKKYSISVEQVAGHIAGIRHYRGDEFMSDKYYESVDEGLTIFEDDTLLFEPGTRFSYSSYGWNLISAVIEGAAGREFLPFMEDRVFKPLQMNHTMPDYTTRDIPARTSFYILQNDELAEAPSVDNSYKWAGGGFLSTTEDMIRFGQAHLSNDFLSEETVSRLMSPLELEDGSSTGFGIGWQTITDSKGHTWKGHSGGSVGGSTMFMMHMEKEIIIALTINRSNAPARDLAMKLADIFYEKGLPESDQ